MGRNGNRYIIPDTLLWLQRIALDEEQATKFGDEIVSRITRII